MVVDTKIQLVFGDTTYPYSAAAAAAQVIAALGGNPTKDTCKVVINHAPETNVVHGRVFTNDIRLYSGDALLYTPDHAATQLLAALAGNPTTDTSIVTVQMDQTIGQAGVPQPEF